MPYFNDYSERETPDDLDAIIYKMVGGDWRLFYRVRNHSWEMFADGFDMKQIREYINRTIKEATTHER